MSSETRTCKQCQQEMNINEFAPMGPNRRRRVCDACRGIGKPAERFAAIFDGKTLQIARIEIIQTHRLKIDEIAPIVGFYQHVGYEVLERPLIQTKGASSGKTQVKREIREESESGNTHQDRHQPARKRQDRAAGDRHRREGAASGDAPVQLRLWSAPRRDTRSDPRSGGPAGKSRIKGIRPSSEAQAEKKRPNSESQREALVAGD